MCAVSVCDHPFPGVCVQFDYSVCAVSEYSPQWTTSFETTTRYVAERQEVPAHGWGNTTICEYYGLFHWVVFVVFLSREKKQRRVGGVGRPSDVCHVCMMEELIEKKTTTIKAKSTNTHKNACFLVVFFLKG